jgi:hypothetical protein
MLSNRGDPDFRHARLRAVDGDDLPEVWPV